MYKTHHTGISILEVVIGVSIMALVLLGFFNVFNQVVIGSRNNTRMLQASFLLEEGVEILRTTRDASWNDIADLDIETPYYLTFSGDEWKIDTVVATIDGIFERYFTLSDVARDANDDIAETGSRDENTRRVTMTVSWSSGGETVSRSITTFIHNVFPS